jgi:hypothetical protein
MTRPTRLLGVLLLTVCTGCPDERSELMGRQHELVQQRDAMLQVLGKELAGKKELTAEEMARVGPLWLEMRRVVKEIGEVQMRLATMQ